VIAHRVLLTTQQVPPALVAIGYETAKQGAFPPLLPVIRQPRVERTVRPLDLLMPDPVEPRVSQQCDQLAFEVYAVGMLNR